jgi:hypothetical protein
MSFKQLLNELQIVEAHNIFELSSIIDENVFLINLT